MKKALTLILLTLTSAYSWGQDVIGDRQYRTMQIKSEGLPWVWAVPYPSSSNYYPVLHDFDWSNLANLDSLTWTIKDDHDLGGGVISLPDDVTLKFEGGYLYNYSEIVGSNTRIIADDEHILETGDLTGDWDIPTANAMWFGANGEDNISDYISFVEAEKVVDTHDSNLRIPSGDYFIEDQNMPFRNKDYQGIEIFGDGEQTVIKTISPDGADVWQFNDTQNILLRDMSITATLTGFNDAGSNGVSITGTSTGIRLRDLNFFNLPYVDKVTYGDGGKAVSIQKAGSTGVYKVDVENIKVDSCLYGFSIDGILDDLINGQFPQVSVDGLEVSNSYRGVSVGNAANTIPYTNQIVNSSVFIDRVHTFNCQQDVVAVRQIGASINHKTQKTLPKSSLMFLPSDTRVFSTLLSGNKRVQIETEGYVFDADAATIFESVLFGAGFNSSNEYCDYLLNINIQSGLDIDYQTVNGQALTESRIEALDQEIPIAALDPSSNNFVVSSSNSVSSLALIDPAGSILKGSGFTIAKPSVGQYVVTHNFGTNYSVNINVDPSTPSNQHTATVESKTATSFRVHTRRHSTGAFSDAGFNFIVF